MTSIISSDKVTFLKGGGKASAGGGFRSTNRLKVSSDGVINVASHNQLYVLEIQCYDDDDAHINKERADVKSTFSVTNPLKHCSLKLMEGSGGPHRVEVMGLATSRGGGKEAASPFIVSVDALGQLALKSSSSPNWRMLETACDPSMVTCSIADVAINHDNTMSISAHADSRRILLHDLEYGKVVGTFWSRHPPTAVSFIPDSPTKMMALEQQQASLWDLRCCAKPGNEPAGPGLVTTFQPAYERLNAIDAFDNDVAIGGEGGILYIYDLRKMSLVARNPVPSKHEVIGLSRSRTNSKNMYAVGNDNELMLCPLQEKDKSNLSKLHLNQHKCFRAASSYIGLDVVSRYVDSTGKTTDTVFVLCSEGHVYSVQDSEFLGEF